MPVVMINILFHYTSLLLIHTIWIYFAMQLWKLISVIYSSHYLVTLPLLQVVVCPVI